MKVVIMIMYVRIDYNLKYKKKKWEEKYYLVIFFCYWLIISVKKVKVVSLVIKREKCFDWWEVGSVEIN